MNLKKYLVSRATSMLAWVGAIGIALEVLLHLGHISTLMLIFFGALFVAPEAYFHGVFQKWARKLEQL